MPKNIVVCSDGTGNTAVKGRGTNVFKFFEAIDLNGDRTDEGIPQQVAFYDDGVGTEAFKPLKRLAGATGYGLSRNVRQLYKEVCRIYDPGDRLYLVGFSRGAFTVRTLAGIITRCGILDVRKLKTARALEAAVGDCYRSYRRLYRTELVKRFREVFARGPSSEGRLAQCLEGEPPRIAFLGVWDTVDAVGLPFHLGDIVNTFVYRFKFPDHKLPKGVELACHALALDDERHTFHPVLWDERGEPGDRIQQVWFAGAHANVGGGYPKQGMSLVALDWMMTQAEAAGLRFLGEDRAVVRDHANVDDKLYDPRSGLGALYRWCPRDVAKLCARHGVRRPLIHESVLQRVVHRTDDYSPGNLPATVRVASTETGNRVADEAAQRRARAAEAILDDAGAGYGLLERVRPAVVLGRAAYYVFLVSATLVLLGALTLEGWTTLLFWSLLGGVTTSSLASLYARRRTSDAFTGFWHHVQPILRDAVKPTRPRAQAEEQQAA